MLTIGGKIKEIDNIPEFRRTPEQVSALAGLRNEMRGAQHEYDGTESGQKALNALISRATPGPARDNLINRQLLGKETYDSKFKAYKLSEKSGSDPVQALFANAPAAGAATQETPAQKRQRDVNAAVNLRAEIEPYNTISSYLPGVVTTRQRDVVPDGYFVVSGRGKSGFGQTHYVLSGTGPEDPNAKILGHVNVHLNPDFSVRAEAYRGTGVVGGKRIENKQSSHLDYFQEILTPGHKSPERAQFDFDDLRRIDWAHS